MLVLNRKNGEEIRIGNDIVIKILGVSEGGVKLGFEAPRSLPILRGELYSNVKENVIEATKQSNLSVDITHTLKINKLKASNNE